LSWVLSGPDFAAAFLAGNFPECDSDGDLAPTLAAIAPMAMRVSMLFTGKL